MSLRRLTLLFIAAFMTATIATGVGTYVAGRITITRLVDRRIAAISDVVASAGQNRKDSAAAMLAQIGAITGRRDTGDIGFVLLDAQGRQSGGNVAVGRTLPQGFSTLEDGDGIAGLSRGRALVRPVGRGMTLVTIAETEPIDDYSGARIRILLGGFGSIILVVLGGVVGFSKLVARRSAATRLTAQAISAGDLTQRIPVRGVADEFDRQAVAFNAMLDRIAELMAGMRHISDDIAHDLRAPLARLRGQVAAIAAGSDDAARQSRVAAAIAQCDDILALFAAILRIADIESGARTAGFVPVEIGALVRDLAEMMIPVAIDNGQVIHLGETAHVSVTGDPKLLTQALINLIENALAHTPPETTIAVAVRNEGGDAIVTVTDDGPGIPLDRRDAALRRFGRLDPSRSRAGHGLGLPLVEAIARLHGGTIVLADAGPGLAATMTIPGPAVGNQKLTPISAPNVRGGLRLP